MKIIDQKFVEILAQQKYYFKQIVLRIKLKRF